MYLLTFNNSVLPLLPVSMCIPTCDIPIIISILCLYIANINAVQVKNTKPVQIDIPAKLSAVIVPFRN